MSNNQSITDPELVQLEQLLGGISFTANKAEQTRLLLACGRAEGRAESQKTMRRWKAATLALSTVAACLVVALILNPPTGAMSDLVPLAETNETTEPESQSAPVTPIRHALSPDALHVATDWNDALKQPRRKPEPTSDGPRLPLPQQSVLMTSSRINLQEFIDQ